MPHCSVLQGSKMLSLLYAIFTIETVEVKKIMCDKSLFKMITGQDLQEHNIIDHKTFTYVDDTQHVVSSKNIDQLQNYMQDLHILLINLYKHNSLSINADKTEFMNFVQTHEEAESVLTITDDQGNLIKMKKTINILGYKVNKENNLEDHMAALMSRITLSHNKIKGQLRY